MKTCIRCKKEKEIDCFYRHPRMADGRVGECKECQKKYQRKRRVGGCEKRRWLDPKRRAYAAIQQKIYRLKNPEKNRARQALSRAIKLGRIIRLPCQVCGEPKSQGHHDDYSKPLDVRWLCFKHHREIGHGQTVTE